MQIGLQKIFGDLHASLGHSMKMYTNEGFFWLLPTGTSWGAEMKMVRSLPMNSRKWLACDVQDTFCHSRLPAFFATSPTHTAGHKMAATPTQLFWKTCSFQLSVSLDCVSEH